jgi:hypothetical protein
VRWREALEQADGALEDFEQMLRERIAHKVRQIDTAGRWDQVLELRGAKKALEQILLGIDFDRKEAEAQAKYRHDAMRRSTDATR